MIVIQPKGKAHISYIRQMARDIMMLKALSIEECIREALDWHRDLCQKAELEERQTKKEMAETAQKQRCIHQWRIIDSGMETGAYIWQCEFCHTIEVDERDHS